MDTPLEREIGDLHLGHPLMNAAGPRCKTLPEIEELAKNEAVAAVVAGSFTAIARPSNEGETYWSNGADSLNALGLPNGGIAQMEEEIPQMVKIAHAHNKPLIVSIAGFSLQDYVSLAVLVRNWGADACEINLGCPNVGGKRVIAYQHDLASKILHDVRWAVASIPLWAKVSPYPDGADIPVMAHILYNSGIDAVTATNTFPNALAFYPNGGSCINPSVNNGMAGMGGAWMKGIGLGQVRQWRAALDNIPGGKNVDIIGVGGIQTGLDMYEYLHLAGPGNTTGAAAVQIATAHANRGAKAFESILREYLTFIELDTIEKFLEENS